MTCNDMTITRKRTEMAKKEAARQAAERAKEQKKANELQAEIDNLGAEIDQLIKDDEEFHRLTDGLNTQQAPKFNI